MNNTILYNSRHADNNSAYTVSYTDSNRKGIVGNIGTNKEIPDNQLFISHITINRSGFILAAYLIVLEFIFIGTGLVLGLPLGFFIGISNLQAYSVYNTISIIFIAAKLIIMMDIVIRWLDSYYEVYPGRIVHRSGFIFRHAHVYDSSEISGAELSQGLLGRIFDFGTITLFVDRGEKCFLLPDIQNPHRNLRLIAKILSNKSLDVRMTDSYLPEDD